MVKLMGHLGMALLWSLPAWFLWEWRVTLAFVALALSTAMLPDVDLALNDVSPVVHHGVTHTVVFVVAVSVAAGAAVTWLARPRLEGTRLVPRGDAVSDRRLFAFVTGAFLLGGFSHLFTDTLSAPDIAAPLDPFWPFFELQLSVDLIYYSSFRWNVGLLAVAVSLHAILAILQVSIARTSPVSGEATDSDDVP